MIEGFPASHYLAKYLEFLKNFEIVYTSFEFIVAQIFFSERLKIFFHNKQMILDCA